MDGCKGGWLVALADGWPPREPPQLYVGRTFADVLALTEACAAVVVDMPIGLPGPAPDWPRACDVAARKELGRGGASRVFNAPPRETLAARDVRHFQELHGQLCAGTGAGYPVWPLVPKLREVDAAMTPELQPRVREFHPELAWLRLAGRLLASKHTRKGLDERRQLLAPHVPVLAEAAADDILDALVGLHVAHGLTQARVTAQRIPPLPCPVPVDARGLRMEIWY